MERETSSIPAGKVSAWEWTIMALVSAALLLFSWLKIVPLPPTEILGFVTGGACVWLVVREHMWNWPIGVANNILFFILFFQSRLYADTTLQVIYLGLGLYGWWNWLYGGTERSHLHISRTTPWEWGSLALMIPLGTLALQELLIRVNGAAPFWDSLTTVLSLAAQYLLCRKRLENWVFWIAADLIYVPLYVSRDLFLTAFLYGIFLILCLIGIRKWTFIWKTLSPQPA